MARQDFNARWAQTVEGQSSSTIFQNPGSRLPLGWEGGADKDAPPAGQQNWWQNRVDSALQDLERYGVMTWVASAVYAAGAPVKSLTDNNYYESLINGNVGQDPVSTTGAWRLVGPSLYDVVPVGSGLIVYHNNVPDVGWLKCNGAVLLRSTYPRLFNAIGTIHNTGGEAGTQFRLPDMRGEFPRGWDDGRGIDTGRSIGSAQGHSLQLHNHFLPTGTGATASGVASIPDATFTTTQQVNNQAAPGLPITTYPNNQFSDYPSVGVGSMGTFSTETRPRNKAVNFWIKY